MAVSSQGSRFVVSRIASRQKEVSMATQARISITKSILDSVKNIKMMGIVNEMEAKIKQARKLEIVKYINLNRLFVAFNASGMMLTIFSPAITLIIFSVQAELRAIIGLVTSPANTLLVMSAHMASAIASFDRIQAYLSGSTREDKRNTLQLNYGSASTDQRNNHDIDQSKLLLHPDSGDEIDHAETVISFEDVSIHPANSSHFAMRDLNIEIKKGCLTVCCGPVGAGKTSFVKALLGDLSPNSGVIQVQFDQIAYCSQNPWLPNATIKDIIKGPQLLDVNRDQSWYYKVIEACDLGEDLKHLPDGDLTVIGSRGITLSGGQKHRLALARAIYAHKDMIVLDDVLSAFDATTQKRIVGHLFGPMGLFKKLGTTVILLTHATRILPLADHIIVLTESGNIAEQGPWDELRSHSGHISELVLKERYEIQEELKTTASNEDNGPTQIAATHDITGQDMTRRIGDIRLYGYYFSTIGWSPLLMMFCTMTFYAVSLGFMPYWLRLWAESENERIRYYAGVYFLLALCSFISVTLTLGNNFLVIAPRSGRVLHAKLLHTVMAAPLSSFASTDTGNVLNRFSSDVLMIDRRLPPSLLQVGQCLFTLLSQAVLLAVVQPLMAITLPFTSVTIYLIQKVYLATSRQLRYLELEAKALLNSSFVETLDGVATIRAFGWQQAFVEDKIEKLDHCLRPWYLMMCLQRWLNVTMDLIVLCIAMLVISLAIAFRGTTTGGQIGIALNVVLLANQSLLKLVESWTIMETSLGAISRLRTFEKDVKPEAQPGEGRHPEPDWPAQGSIVFDNMSAAYDSKSLALKSINLAIQPGTKVGICGRTGSGKSSLMLTVLRLIEIESGTIWIDGIDLKTLSRETIRSCIITVPQDSALVMTDTVRQNLDIKDSGIPDDKIIHALEKVKLWSAISARATRNQNNAYHEQQLEDVNLNGEGSEPLIARYGSHHTDESGREALDMPMSSLVLSQGQRQLFSLARALLMRPYRGNIVLLDEATSSVDADTDKLMQQIIRTEFKEHTVLTIAHRVGTILDSDVVMVLDAGNLVQFGSPAELALKDDGMFKDIYLR